MCTAKNAPKRPGRLGGGAAFALRRHGPDRRDPDVGEADRLRDDSAERGRGAGPAAGRASARLSAARSPALGGSRPCLNPTAVRGQGLLLPAAPGADREAAIRRGWGWMWRLEPPEGLRGA